MGRSNKVNIDGELFANISNSDGLTEWVLSSYFRLTLDLEKDTAHHLFTHLQHTGGGTELRLFWEDDGNTVFVPQTAFGYPTLVSTNDSN